METQDNVTRAFLAACQRLDKVADCILGANDHATYFPPAEGQPTSGESQSTRSLKQPEDVLLPTVPSTLQLGSNVTTHRHPSRNTLASRVRRTVRTLFRMPNYREQLPRGPRNDQPTPTPEAFSVEWDEDFNSSWNLRARDIVVDRVLSTYSAYYSDDDRGRIEAAVLTHLQSLRNYYYQTMHLTPEMISVLAKRQELKTVKRDRYLARLKVITDPRLPRLHRHRVLLEALGLSNMSSDEEAIDAHGQPYLSSKRKYFVSRTVSAMFWEIDKVYERYFKPDHVVLKRRERSKFEAAKHALSGLPYNIYNPIFIASLSQAERAQLNPSPNPYDLSL